MSLTNRPNSSPAVVIILAATLFVCVVAITMLLYTRTQAPARQSNTVVTAPTNAPAANQPPPAANGPQTDEGGALDDHAYEAVIPKITGMDYNEARGLLMGAGWEPIAQDPSFASDPNVSMGNGLAFWKQGFTEITSASGTGEALARFEWKNANGKYLSIITAGEEDPEQKLRATVKLWEISDEPVK